MLYYPIITPFFLFFALLHTSNALPSRRSGTGGGSTTPGASLPYGDNSNGDSYLQSYSVGTAAFPAVYTQLSNAAWNQWWNTGNNKNIPHYNLPLTDFRCNGKIFTCLVIEQTPSILVLGSIYQGSPALNCGNAPICTASSSTAISIGTTLGWQAQLGVQVEFSKVKITGAGTFVENWTTTTSDSTTETCGAQAGQTVCLAYQPILWQSLMRCTIRGVSLASYKNRAGPNYESWSCPLGNQVPVQVEEAGADKRGVGAWTCVIGSQACSAGFGNVINHAYLNKNNVKATTKTH